jgi:peroxiredoxin
LSLQRPFGPPWRDLWSRTRRLSPLLAALALAAVGAAAAQQPYVLDGQPAPDFTLHAASGPNVRLSEHRGKVVVLSFWSSGCGSCRLQLQALGRSAGTYASAGLVLYGVSVDDRPLEAQKYAHDATVGFPLLLDADKSVARAYQVDMLPMTVLIDRNGVVRYALRDFRSGSNELYLQRLRALLNE